jgi:hypothetical protein
VLLLFVRRTVHVGPQLSYDRDVLPRLVRRAEGESKGKGEGDETVAALV